MKIISSVMALCAVLLAGCTTTGSEKQTNSFTGTWAKAPNFELVFANDEFILSEGEQGVKSGTYFFTAEQLSIRSGSIRQMAFYTITDSTTLEIMNENWQMGGWEKFVGTWTKVD
ncbi:MAG: hypothetical protein LBQ38_08270 [Spirochaetaceae bacterium]|jgi:hypothetical protein|nr:hypothetical protein [Spirochaetaceae bacterium]